MRGALADSHPVSAVAATAMPAATATTRPEW
jgi:hypothetical protein